MAKAKSSKKQKQEQPIHGIENLGVALTTKVEGAIHNAAILTQPSDTLLSNPLDFIDKLSKMSPFWSNVAQRVITTTIGWYAVNSTLWAYRKRNQQPKVTSGIDWLNDSINEAKEKIENERVAEEQGLSRVPFVDGAQFMGAYKYLFDLVNASPDIPSMDKPTPAVLYARMQKERDSAETLEAYEKFENEQFKHSKNFAYIAAKMKDFDAKASERLKKKQQDELDHIHTELAGAAREPFDDGVWMRLPLWSQYKINRSLYNQIVSAIVAEDDKKPEERIYKTDLMKLGETVLLELEAAYRMPEVRKAFEDQVLKDQHRLLQ